MKSKIKGVLIFSILLLVVVLLFPSTVECPDGPCMPKPDAEGKYSLYYNTRPLIFRLLNIPLNYDEGSVEYNINNEK